MRPVVLVAAVCVVYSSEAAAYIDPGTGMLVLQGIMALIFGVVAFLKDPIGGLRKLFSDDEVSNSTDGDSASEDVERDS